jgi:hypothetical protein
MSEPRGVRGSALTGVAMTAKILNDRSSGVVPGGLVMHGRFDVYYLAVCHDCGDLVVPFEAAGSRDEWAAAHPHDVVVGIEIRE